MKHALPPLDSLKAFESAARHLSFTRAAAELCISKGAMSHQIRKLEESVDCALFRRSVRQVYLTDAGQQLLKTTQRVFRELEGTFGRLAPRDRTKNVYVGATTYVAMRWLSAKIAGYTELNPEVSIVLQHSVNSEDFKIQDVDIAIQWGRCASSPDRNCLLEIPLSLYPVCSPNLLHRLGVDVESVKSSGMSLATPPFSSVPLLCEDRPMDLWQEWYGDMKCPLPNPRRVITDANVRTQAAMDGQGWTLADAFMQGELDRKLLVAPFENVLEGYGYRLIMPQGRYLNQSARDLIEWLLEASKA